MNWFDVAALLVVPGTALLFFAVAAGFALLVRVFERRGVAAPRRLTPQLEQKLPPGLSRIPTPVLNDVAWELSRARMEVGRALLQVNTELRRRKRGKRHVPDGKTH